MELKHYYVKISRRKQTSTKKSHEPKKTSTVLCEIAFLQHEKSHRDDVSVLEHGMISAAWVQASEDAPGHSLRQPWLMWVHSTSSGLQQQSSLHFKCDVQWNSEIIFFLGKTSSKASKIWAAKLRSNQRTFRKKWSAWRLKTDETEQEICTASMWCLQHAGRVTSVCFLQYCRVSWKL